MNQIIFGFVSNNWMWIFILVLLPIFPPNWFDLDPVYTLQDGTTRKRMKLNFLAVVFKLFVQPINQLIIDLSVLFNFKTTTSLLIFVVIGAELYYQKQISQHSVVLVAISLIILYLELLIEKAKKISIWKLFEWESK